MPPPSPNVTALIDALDARARQAGNEGAATLVSGMLATLAESLAGVDRRLEMIEESTARLGAADLVESVQSNLGTFNARLGRLEEAFVQAVNDSGSGTQEVVDQIQTAVLGHLRDELAGRVDRLQATVESRRDPAPSTEMPDVGAAVTAALAPVLERLRAIESRPAPAPTDLGPVLDRLKAIESRPVPEFPKVELPDVGAAVTAALAPVLERLRAIESRPVPEFPKAELPDVGAAVTTALAPVLERLRAIESRPGPTPTDLAPVLERLRAIESRPAPAPTDLSPVLDRLKAIESRPAPEFPDVGAAVSRAIEEMPRDETSARVVALVEERIDAIIRAVGDRADKVAADVASLLTERDTLARRVAEIDVALTQLRASVESSGSRTDSINRQIDELRRAVDQSTERSADVIRREAELLTQRVASLAVGVEATRGMSEQIASAYEQSLTRRAGIVGRRLAKDLGLSGRRGSTGRGDRELGRGD